MAATNRNWAAAYVNMSEKQTWRHREKEKKNSDKRLSLSPIQLAVLA